MNNFLLYAASVLIWGSTWIAINYQLGDVSPEVSVAYRYALAALLLFAWCLWRGKQLSFGWRDHRVFLALGTLMFGFNYICSYSAQLHISSALNAIGFSSLVWMNLINARLFLGTQLEWKVIIGAVIGMAGIVSLFWPSISDLELSGSTLIGAGFSLAAAFLASLGNIVSQKAQGRGLAILPSNAWGMLYGAVIVTSIALLKGDSFEVQWSWSYGIALVYLAVFGSILAFGAYLKLLGNIGAHKAGYAVVMFPVVAIIISMLFEGLQLSTHLVIGMILALGGNTMILSWRARKTPGGSQALTQAEMEDTKPLSPTMSGAAGSILK